MNNKNFVALLTILIIGLFILIMIGEKLPSFLREIPLERLTAQISGLIVRGETTIDLDPRISYSYTAISYSDAGGNISYKFSWADGQTANKKAPSGKRVSVSRKFAKQGTYYLFVKVTDKKGYSAEEVHGPIVVANSGPKFNLRGFVNEKFKPGKKYNYVVEIIEKPFDSIVSHKCWWQEDFSCGIPKKISKNKVQYKFSIVFPAPGWYTIYFEATDSFGMKSEGEHTVILSEK